MRFVILKFFKSSSPDERIHQFNSIQVRHTLLYFTLLYTLFQEIDLRA